MRTEQRLSRVGTSATLAVVAAAFARASYSATLHECARDAAAFLSLALAIQRAGAATGDATARATTIARRYGARVHTPLDPHGMSVGLSFSPSVHSSGFRSILFVC